MKDLLVKVCGMRDPSNIVQLASLGIDYMGFIFYEKSARYTPKIPEVELPKQVKKTGVFVNAASSLVEEKIAEGLQAIQLHGQESPTYCQSIKATGIELIKAFGVDEQMDWEPLAPYIGIVDYFLFDTRSSQHGGTGRTFDWRVLDKYPYDTPYFLSGGLDLTNLAEALNINDQRLVALDLNSKFEQSPGLKDIAKLTQALKIIKHE